MDSSYSGMFVKLTASPIFIKSNRFGGGKREKLKRLLTEFQLRATQEEVKSARKSEDLPCPWLADVKDTVYDLETLLEDIELQEMAESESQSGVKDSRILKLIEAQKEFDEWLSNRYGSPDREPSLEDRVDRILERLEELNHVVKGSSAADLRLIDNHDEKTPRSYHSNKVKLDFLDLLADDPLKYHLSNIPPSPRGGASFYDLPWYLKQCYAFCRSLFRPYHPVSKQVMVLLWVAAGFVQPIVGKTLEDVAAGYFDALVHWSFIQYPDHTLNLERSLPSSISERGEFHMVESSKENVPRRIRHASLICDKRYETIYKTPSGSRTIYCESFFRPVSKSSGLYTLMVASRGTQTVDVPDDIFLQLKELRVLDLSGCKIHELHPQFCKLTHLRHLDLSCSNIEVLPSWLPYLFRLKTLVLIRSRMNYPENFHFLANNLHHLILCCYSNMPPNIGPFTSLQTLPNFIVSKQSESSSIGQLSELNELRGKLCVSGLENVETLEEAQTAKFHLKCHLKHCELKWTEHSKARANYGIIEGLKPPQNIRKIRIEGFKGLRLPSWLSDTSFTNLSSICIHSCILHRLPALGKLPQLKKLVIEFVQGLKKIDAEFYGSFIRIRGFPQLRSLKISDLDDLEDWIEWRWCDFPLLEKLKIENCPNLKSLPRMRNLPKLRKLCICDCDELESLPRGGIPSNVKSLSISSCMGLYLSHERGGSDWDKVSDILEIEFV